MKKPFAPQPGPIGGEPSIYWTLLLDALIAIYSTALIALIFFGR